MNGLLLFDLLVNSRVENICYKVCLFLTIIFYILIFYFSLHFSVPLCLGINVQQTVKFSTLMFKLLLGKYTIMIACSVILCTIYI